MSQIISIHHCPPIESPRCGTGRYAAPGILAAVRGVVVLLAGLMSAMLASSAEARSLREIVKSRELRICISPYHPSAAVVEPAGCTTNCRIGGIVYEQTLAFARSLDGVAPRFRVVGWDEQFFNRQGKVVRDASYTPERLESGLCDFYPNNLTKNEWRQKKLAFVTQFPSRMMLIVPKAKLPQYKTPTDLAGRTAAEQKDSSYHSWLDEQNRGALAANPVRLELTTTMKEALDRLEQGAVDFVIADSDLAMWATRNELKNSTIAFPVGPVDEIGWAFRHNDKDLQAAVEKFFDEQRKNPESELNRLWKQNFGRTLTEFIALMVAVK